MRLSKGVRDAIVPTIVLLCMGGCTTCLVRGCNQQEAIDAKQESDRIANTKTVNETKSIPIYSLSLNSEIDGHISGGESGSFFLGIGDISGSINGSITQNSVYYFYKDSGNGGIILDKVDASSVPLVKTNDAPHLETVTAITQEYRRVIDSKIISQRLFVPVNYKLLGEFKK